MVYSGNQRVVYLWGLTEKQFFVHASGTCGCGLGSLTNIMVYYKVYNSGTAKWKGCIRVGIGEGTGVQCPLQAHCLPAQHLEVFTNPETLLIEPFKFDFNALWCFVLNIYLVFSNLFNLFLLGLLSSSSYIIWLNHFYSFYGQNLREVSTFYNFQLLSLVSFSTFIQCQFFPYI